MLTTCSASAGLFLVSEKMRLQVAFGLMLSLMTLYRKTSDLPLLLVKGPPDSLAEPINDRAPPPMRKCLSCAER